VKKFISIFILSQFVIFAQEDHFGELVIELINKGSTWNVTFTLTAISARWDQNYDLTDNYSIVNDNVNSNPPSEATAYFDHILDPWAGINPIFAIGLYKLSAFEGGIEQAYFFIDWRTSDGSIYGDLNFKYDVGNNNFRNWANTQTINFDYKTLWDLTNVSLETSGFEDYWDNCLALTNESNYHPRLVFGPYPTTVQGTITGYNLYRSASHIPGQQPSNFTLLTALGLDEFYYVDNTVTIGTDYNAKSYYVKCVYEDPWESINETGPTNIVEVRLQIPQKIFISDFEEIINYEYQLEQNYPNPFNPSTIISWENSKDVLVTLKVFDILGREVATLVDEQKKAGNHFIEFDASALPSGIYIYKIQMDKYQQSRKMILQK